MVKLSVCVLFGGMSPEHAVSLRSAESVLNNMDPEKYNIFPVGITQDGDWLLYGSTDYSKIATGEWVHCPQNRRAGIVARPPGHARSDTDSRRPVNEHGCCFTRRLDYCRGIVYT